MMPVESLDSVGIFDYYLSLNMRLETRNGELE